MPNWKHKLPLKDIWEWAETVDKEMYAAELGEKIANRIDAQPWRKRSTGPKLHTLLDQICVEFREVETIHEFDEVLATLYDWADEGHRCWVETF